MDVVSLVPVASARRVQDADNGRWYVLIGWYANDDDHLARPVLIPEEIGLCEPSRHTPAPAVLLPEVR